MVIEAIETYVIVGVIGFIVGVAVSRLFYKHRIQQKSIGQAIGFAVIEKQVAQLGSMTIMLNGLVYKIKTCSEDIFERIELIRDIEESVVPGEKEVDVAGDVGARALVFDQYHLMDEEELLVVER